MPKGRNVPPQGDPFRKAREELARVVFANWPLFATTAYEGFRRQGRGAMVFSTSEVLNKGLAKEGLMPAGGIAASYAPESEVYDLLAEVLGPEALRVAEAKTLRSAIGNYTPETQVVFVALETRGRSARYLCGVCPAPSEDTTPEVLSRGGPPPVTVPAA